MNCRTCKSDLPDLLLNPAAPGNAAARAHLAGCAACAHELASLEATMALLDIWQAPEVSTYFDQKLAVRLREEQAAPAPGWFERLKTRLLFNTGRQFRPAVVGLMALLLIAGGGSIGITSFPTTHHTIRVSATVNDLQILDKNAQALQQVDQILNEANASANNSAPPQS